MDENCVFLSKDAIRFEQISKVTNVFFDETNKQLFTVRSGGVMGVKVQGSTADLCHSFRMQDKGPVISIKLSPAQTVLAVQRSKTTVDLFNLRGSEIEEIGYSQGSRYKGADILGFVWSCSQEIIIVSTHGVELFQVFPDKRAIRALRHVSVNVCWYISCPATRLIVLAGGAAATTIQPISYLQPGTIDKTPKFQIDVPVTSTKGILLERDVTVTQIYGQTCILVTRHPPRPPGAAPPLAQVLVYTMHKTLFTVRRTHTLSLEASGKIALSVVDNLVLVHHQPSKSTLIFDTGGDTGSAEPLTIKAFLSGQSIRPFTAQLDGQSPFQCQLYAPQWVVFQPNIIIDARIGFFWYVDLDLKLLIKASKLSAPLVDLLLRRKSDIAMPLILEVLEKIATPDKSPELDMTTIADVFDTINKSYRREVRSLAQHQIALPAGVSAVPLPKDQSPETLVIDQGLMYSHVFSKFPMKKGLDDYDGEMAIKIILEYIRSLADVLIPARDLNELLITCLMNEDHGLARLQQLLQYRVLSDSKPLACALISLEQSYPPALQLSLDMLKRLGTADDEIMEILLHKGAVVAALRYAVSVGQGDKISARKFLKAAEQTGERVVFFSVYRYFELRNLRQRGATGFVKGELCDAMVEHFRNLFIERIEPST